MYESFEKIMETLIDGLSVDYPAGYEAGASFTSSSGCDEDIRDVLKTMLTDYDKLDKED